MRHALLATTVRVALLGGILLAGDPAELRTRSLDSYLTLARALAGTGHFGLAPGGYEIFRPPGYPVLLVPGVILGHHYAVAILLHLALAAATVLLVMATARRLAGAASAAGVVTALDPVLIVWTVALTAETTFTCAVAALCRVLVGHMTPRRAAACGGLAALAAYVKPIAWPLPILLVPAVAWTAARGNRRHAAACAAASLAAWAAVVAPWHARNYVHTGYPVFSTIVDRALYFSSASAVLASEGRQPFVALYEGRRAEVHEILVTPGPQASRAYARLRSDGLATVLTAPGRWLRIHLAGIARTLFDPGMAEWFRVLGWYPQRGGLLGAIVDRGVWPTLGTLARERPLLVAAMAVGVLWTLAVLTLAGAGAVLAVRDAHTRPLAIRLLAVLVLFAALSGGPHGYHRFRHPMMPMLAVFAAVAVSRWRPYRGVPSVFQRYSVRMLPRASWKESVSTGSQSPMLNACDTMRAPGRSCFVSIGRSFRFEDESR